MRQWNVKRWNKQKRYRETSWTKVSGLSMAHSSSALDWCRKRDGKKFFNESMSIFYFEDAEDATAFYLTWINKAK